MNRKPLIKENGEVRELTAEDFKSMKPVSELMPELVALQKRARGRPKAEKTKQSVTVRLDSEVLEFFRAGGRGWQTRLNEALKEHVQQSGQ